MIHRLLKTLGMGALALTTGMLAPTAVAQPSTRPIQLIVNNPAGGSLDAIARLFAERASGPFKGRVVVVNKPGAGGALAEGEAARSAADGHTILFGGSTTAVNSVIYEKPTYDPAAIQSVAILMTLPFVVVTNTEVPAKNLLELLALARKEPKALAAASPAGSTLLATHLMQQAAGVDFQIIPYNGGPPAALALMRNDVQVMVADIASMSQNIRAGKMRALAVTGKDRVRMLPEIPTTAEAGLPGFKVENWFGVFAPRGVPAEFLQQLNAEVNRFLRDPDVVSRFHTLGGSPSQMSVAESEKYYQDTRTMWKGVLTENKIPLR